MPRRKRSSDTIDKAQRRLAGIRSIDPNLNLGNSLTTDSFATLINDSQQKLEAYNTALSIVDQTYNEILQTEQALAEYSERMLTGVASKYGRYSNEYVMAGGSPRRTTRRRTAQSAPTLASLPAPTPTTNGTKATVSAN
ncbi:MAG: hypothetical protein KME07_09895 [Pegethrix bostrychoides GSE-TBD4-15B]|jgi:hypothetical protein|uniref:Uncharacterized protein n=1 Tax=Pegethrix bostrychoides GSE-TBD4-15B TaxID=2839662 RepID=A0A951U4G6_9CYAN|nr:hypothetical protein [Pegethrix bostrychoides GSE-TBD4-15B]